MNTHTSSHISLPVCMSETILQKILQKIFTIIFVDVVSQICGHTQTDLPGFLSKVGGKATGCSFYIIYHWKRVSVKNANLSLRMGTHMHINAQANVAIVCFPFNCLRTGRGQKDAFSWQDMTCAAMETSFQQMPSAVHCRYIRNS